MGKLRKEEGLRSTPLKLHHLRGCQKEATEERKESVLWVLQETDTEIELENKGFTGATHGKEREAELEEVQLVRGQCRPKPTSWEFLGAKIPVRV